MRRLLVILLAVGCREEPGLVSELVLEQWSERGDLAEPSSRGHRCSRLHDLAIDEPETMDEYKLSCPLKSWSCLRWDQVPAVRSLFRPVAVMSPLLPRELVMANAAHEDLHAVYLCAYGNYNRDHSDTRVWEHYLPNDDADVESRVLIRLGY